MSKKKIFGLLPVGTLLFSLSFASCTTDTNDKKAAFLEKANTTLENMDRRLEIMGKHSGETKVIWKKIEGIQKETLDVLKGILNTLKLKNKESV